MAAQFAAAGSGDGFGGEPTLPQVVPRTPL